MSSVTQNEILNFLKLIRPVRLPISYARIGSERDGGYVVPSDFFKRVDAVISAGVSNNDAFEVNCATLGLPVYAIDPTISQIPNPHPKISFYQEAFGLFEGKFHNNFDSLILNLNLNKKKILFKFDVECSEWPGLFYSSDEALSHIQIIVGEFHEFRQLSVRKHYDLMLQVMQKLAAQFHVVVISSNNVDPLATINGISIPNLLEITFVNKDYCKLIGEPVYQLGPNHTLSTATDSTKDDYLWNPSWYLISDY
jgi:hypothetical protein